jgi:hypothetical protein
VNEIKDSMEEQCVKDWVSLAETARDRSPLSHFPVTGATILTMSRIFKRQEQEIEAMRARVQGFIADDMPDQYSQAINATHPLKTKRYDLDMVAREMVTKRRSKGALIDLVRWLLTRLAEKDAKE